MLTQSLLTHLAVLVLGLAIGLVLGQSIASLSARKLVRDMMRRHEGETDTLIDGVKHAFAEISSDTLRQGNIDGLQIAKATLQGERRLDAERSAVDRAEIDARIGQILNQMDRMQQLVRELEQTRAGQLGEVAGRLDEANKKAADLTKVTESLKQTLGQSRSRGLWGERLAEEVLQAAGMKPGLSFRRQVTLEGGGRPDFTFDLPGGLYLHMDVKFPFDNYQKSLECEDTPSRQRFENAFVRDIRGHIAETANRNYHDPARSGVGLTLLFIPNERVFAAMLELGPELLDEALRRKIVLVSPASLIAVLSLIRQLSAERRLSDTAQQLAQDVAEFWRQWQVFRTASDKAGQQLEAACESLRSLQISKRRKLEVLAKKIGESSGAVSRENDPGP